ncbi:hypothetical protein ACEP13_14785, partial [Enterococcus faecium]
AMFIGKDDNSAGIQINADGSVIIKGTSLTIEPPTTSSSITSNADIRTSANVYANGKPLDGHSHGGVERGGSNTDPL